MKDIYELIVQKSKDGIWVTDKNDVIYFVNKSMENISGIPKMNILKKNVLTDFPDDTTKDFNHFYQKAKTTLKPVFYKANIVTPAGRDTWQMGWLTPKIADKKYDGIICTIKDITERKLADEALRSSEEKFSKLFQTSPNVLVISSLEDGRIIDMNDEGLRQLGYERDEIVGKTRDEIRLVDFEDVKKLIEMIQKNSYYSGVELKVRLKDGSEKYGLFHGQLIEIGGKSFLFQTIVDMTERKKAEEKIISRNKQLELYNEVTVDRELKVIDLKKEINELLEKYGEESKYMIPV